MGNQTIRVDRERLRRFDEHTEETDAAILGACETVQTALTMLAAGADGIEVPGAGAVDEVRLHHDRCRVLGEVFELVAQRFDKSQTDVYLPAVFAWSGPRWASMRRSRGTGWRALGRMGGRAPTATGRPASAVYNTERDRRWLDKQLKKIRQAPLSPTARGVADHVMRTIGIPKPARQLVDEDVYDLSAGAGFMAQFGQRLSGHVRRYSDGTADVVIYEASEAGADFGVSGGIQILLPGLDVDRRYGASFGLSIGSARSGTWSFATVAEAERFVKKLGAQAYLEQALRFVPGMAGASLAHLYDGEGIDGAPVQTRGWGVDVSGEVSGAVPQGLDLSERGGKVSASMWYTEETNQESGSSTGSARLHVPVVVAAAILGFDSAKGANYSRQVGLTSDDTGQLHLLTVTTDWDGAAAQRPPGAPPAAERRRSESDSADPHHYQHAVTLDLTDARNVDLARRVAAVWDGPGSVLSVKDVMQIAPLVDDDDVYARGNISFTELEVASSAALGLTVDGGFVGKGSIGTQLSKTSIGTVARWEGTGERVTQTFGD